MAKLSYTEEELLREHDYAQPHVMGGYRLHGGFDSEGQYVSPRTAVRWDAVRAWQTSLREAGGDPFPAGTELLGEVRPWAYEQQKLLIREGYGKSLWNSLTITGSIEGRGRALADITAPDFGEVVEEDTSTMAVGHLNRGLFHAHGLDEGGSKGGSLGGHDAMWYAVRDLVFGKDAYPLPEVPASIVRPDREPLVPELPHRFEQTLSFMMNLLMIEVRAELVFSFNERLFREPELFTDRREEAEQAAVLVDRIRQDEQIHVAYLQTVIGELRNCTFRGRSGTRNAGWEVIDSIWKPIVQWHTTEGVAGQRDQVRDRVRRELRSLPDGKRILAEYDALEGS